MPFANMGISSGILKKMCHVVCEASLREDVTIRLSHINSEIHHKKQQISPKTDLGL